MARPPSSSPPQHPPIRIGCAGWSIGSRDAALFGDGDSMLARYATRFDLAEINSSFYRPHRRSTYERWAASVPADFRFSAKLPRTITHEHRLRGCGPLLDAFLEAATGLGDRLGCLLVQLPPSLAFDARSAATFLAMLRRRWDGGIACEVRHASWLAPRAEALLRRHRVARVAADPARHGDDARPGGDPDLAYWRWHGSPRIYASAYDDAALDALAAAVVDRPAARHWIVFDNTAAGHATGDAAALQRRLRPGSGKAPTPTPHRR
ncbi:DUF72 domain-containing protein [Luteimonas sp. FCS-9]|uniref:DUF72 domain-containing protein n=1 Tax=Luteimonas sp. FCS-9 TaxID=1547516 RepID=UPI00063E7046|nr:DUF72 domain-containing protein [Luteimonas sp. FCS-9]KLI98729.1 hypothetical protein WQ56_14465 [Luteimonas sp. FCS-9]